jgi:hypothetical protein
MKPGAGELGKRWLRGALLVLTILPAFVLAQRLQIHGAVAWYFDWPFAAAMLVVALFAHHCWTRLGRPDGATRPHWADSALLHEGVQALDRDLDAEREVAIAPALTESEVKARLDALSRQPDQVAAIAESEALLGHYFHQRFEPVFEADRKRRRGFRERSRVANAVVGVLLGVGLGWMLYLAYF